MKRFLSTFSKSKYYNSNESCKIRLIPGFIPPSFFVLLWGTDEMSFLIWYMLNGDRKRDFLLCHNLKLKQVFSGIIFRVAIANGITWGNKKKKKAQICKINLKSRFLPFVICLCGFLSGVLYFRQPVKWFPLYLHPVGGCLYLLLNVE